VVSRGGSASGYGAGEGRWSGPEGATDARQIGALSTGAGVMHSR